jgi:uncharacterized Zn finger protein
VLVIPCSHCGERHEDDFGLFDAGVRHTMRCPECGNTFHFHIAECSACGGESVFVKGEDEEQDWPHLAVPCLDCGSSLQRMADDPES